MISVDLLRVEKALLHHHVSCQDGCDSRLAWSNFKCIHKALLKLQEWLWHLFDKEQIMQKNWVIIHEFLNIFSKHFSDERLDVSITTCMNIRGVSYNKFCNEDAAFLKTCLI